MFVNGVGGILETELITAEAVRVGRIYKGTVNYRNTGDCDIQVPTLTVSGSFDLKVGYTLDAVYDSVIQFLGIGSPESAGVLRAGESGSVSFYSSCSIGLMYWQRAYANC